jgi:uncharacterized protein (DUF305 family)
VATKRTLASLALVAGIVLGACGGESESSAVDADDEEFVQGMIPHHQQAVEMSTLALDGRAGVAVQDLARRIKSAQDPEIVAMRGILARWGVDEDEHAMHRSASDAAMMGMLTDDELSELASLSGDAFDKRWIEAMVMHHEGAIAMAKAVLAGGDDQEVRALASSIASAQEAEVAELKALLNG